MSASWKWYVYILECTDGSFYTGMTYDPSIRYEQHLSGLGGKYTHNHPVKKLAYLEEFDDLEQARTREKQIQGWTRVKKLNLICGKWKKL